MRTPDSLFVQNSIGGKFRLFARSISRSFPIIILLLAFFTSAFTPAPHYVNKPLVAESLPVTRPVTQAGVIVKLDAIAHGLIAPINLVSPPDGSGRLFVIDQAGMVHIISGRGNLPEVPLLNLRGRLFFSPDLLDPHGLFDLSFHPDFSQNGRFFVYYTVPLRPEAPPGWDHTFHVVEFSISEENLHAIEPNSERILLEFDLPYPHSGRLGFNSDGYLQVTFGDEGRPTFCLDVDKPDYPRVECPQKENSPSVQVDISTQLGISSAHTDIIPGYLYLGQAFPSFQDGYVFVSNGALSGDASMSNRGNSGGNGGRLFITSSPDPDGKIWKIEELTVSNWENGRINEPVRAIAQDSFGELYILTSHKDDPRTRSGMVYKIVPYILSEQSLIDNPEHYLPAPFLYARLVRQAPLYRSLVDVHQNEHFGKHGGDNYWVTVLDQARVNGRIYYSVSWGWGNTAWVSASYLNMNAHLSSLRGVDLRDWEGEPLAMVYTGVHVRSLPGVIDNETIIGALPPYSLVAVLETRQVNGAVWYRIGSDQWSHSNYLRLLIPSPRPPNVGRGEKWVEINLAEQTLIAYEGDRPVLATLAATGRRGLDTEKGLYRTWAILQHGPMQWENITPSYSLANVPWIMYFNRGQGLHGVYWHDLFGTVRSAGCVNLSPHDAHWVFHWAVPEFPAGQRVYYTTKEDPGLWVWVHDRKPDLSAQIMAFQISQADWPEETILPEAEMLIDLGFIP
jgi:hypothetical protein